MPRRGNEMAGSSNAQRSAASMGQKASGGQAPWRWMVVALGVMVAAGWLALSAGVVRAQPDHWVSDAEVGDNASCESPGFNAVGSALAAAEPGDTIHVCAGTYTETITIDKDITLQGAGAEDTIIQAHADPGEATSRVVTITGSSTTVVIERVTIRHGLAEGEETAGEGGGIWNQGDLTLAHSTVSANTSAGIGGGIWNEASLSVDESTLTGNSSGYGGGIANGPDGEAIVIDSEITENGVGRVGGAIYNDGSFTLSNSIVSSNEAPYHHSGGIYNGGDHPFAEGVWTTRATMTITGSTISDNFASGSINFDEELIGDPMGGGGGITNLGGLSLTDSTVSGNSAPTGGGINNFGGILTLTNSTVSGNTAFVPVDPLPYADLNGMGGGVFNAGRMESTNSTFTANSAEAGGGIANAAFVWQGLSFEGVLDLTNTLVADNAAPTGPDVQGAITDGGHNLLGNGAGSSGLTHNENGNLVGSADSPIDPMLGPLQDNGGPTETHAPLLGSPAIGAADNASCPDVDQRGVQRPQPPDGNCDIGSVEVVAGDVVEEFTELIEAVEAPRGTQNLAGQIEASIESDNAEATCGQLTGFINQVEAQSGRRMSEEDANTLIDAAEQLQVLLEC